MSLKSFIMHFTSSGPDPDKSDLHSRDGKYTLKPQKVVPAPPVPDIADGLIDNGCLLKIPGSGPNYLVAMPTEDPGKTKVFINRFKDDLLLGDISGLVMSTLSIGCLILGILFGALSAWTSLQAPVSIALGIAGCTMRYTIGNWSPRHFLLSRPLHCDCITTNGILVTLLYGFQICHFGYFSTKALRVLLETGWNLSTPELYALSPKGSDRLVSCFVIALINCFIIQPERILYTLTFNPEEVREVGEEPRGHMGLIRLVDSIDLTLERVKGLVDLLEKRGVGDGYLANIQNFIDSCKEHGDADYAIAGAYRIRNGGLSVSLSRGVPTQSEILELAKSEWFKDDKDEHGDKGWRNKSSCAYEHKIQDLFDGIEGKDWREVVCGISWHEFLAEAVAQLYLS